MMNHNMKTGLKWSVVPVKYGYEEDIRTEANRMNKEFRKQKVNQVRRAMVQPLPYGMSQLLLLSAR